MSEEIINKVAQSELITLNLEDFYPKEEVAVFDLKSYLFMGLILKEKDFREALNNLDWSVYAGFVVAITCSADAIIPVWAYMLVSVHLQPLAKEVIMGDKDQAIQKLFIRNILSIDVKTYTDKRIVVKGCGDIPIGAEAYLEISNKLRPVVRSLLYGEPCSTVPVFKRK